ncbi:Protein GLUTAMINE DUMPER 4 [Bienertia sinuspersici]
MRLGVTLNIGGAFQTQEHMPHHHLPPPPTASVTGWKSPVPYLFGGLAAMLGLIAFALLILACSYWKLSGHQNSGEDSGDFSGDGKPKDAGNDNTTPFQSSILVIMAGEEKPTFLATPASSRATSFGDSERDNNNNGSCSCSSSSNGGEEDDNNGEKMIDVKTINR